MQFSLSFSALLAGIFIVLSTQDVGAAPLSVKRNAGMVTLPLKRVEHQGRGVHPQIYLQQHINRSRRRLARMTGRAEPSSEELEAALVKRIVGLESSGELSRRYNRIGVPKPVANTAAELVKGVSSLASTKKTQGGKNGATSNAKKGKNTGKAGTSASGNSTATAAGTAGSNATAAGTAASNATAANTVTNANTPTTGDSLGLDIEANDVGYLATVQMGTPPRDFLILMDSGSADLWVGAENCQSQAGGGCGNHNFLGPQSSSSFQDTKAPFSVTYGTGNVAGDIIQDNLVVAGLALNAHTFGVASSESVDFSSNDTPFDGLMGLAQSTLSEQKTATPIESLAAAGLVNEAITSFKISRLADNKNDGEVTFGGLDTTKFDQQTLTTLPNVNTQGFWEGAMDAVTVDGTDTGLQGRTAILDTGTTLIVAPAADAAAVHKLITGAKSDGQGGFTVPCTTTASVALTFGGTSFAIDPRDIAFQPVDATNPNGDCFSGISSGDIGGATEWLVGDVFLKNAYFSTDVGKNTVSLAKLV